MVSKLLIATGMILSLLSMSNSEPERESEFSLNDLFKYGRQEGVKSYSLNEVFNSPVSSKPVDARNLKLSDIFKYGP